MGRLIDGVWHARDRRTDEDGRFIRAETRFRARVTPMAAQASPPSPGATTSTFPSPAPGPTGR